MVVAPSLGRAGRSRRHFFTPLEGSLWRRWDTAWTPSGSNTSPLVVAVARPRTPSTLGSRTTYGAKAPFGGFLLGAQPGISFFWFDHHLIVVGPVGQVIYLLPARVDVAFDRARGNRHSFRGRGLCGVRGLVLASCVVRPPPFPWWLELPLPCSCLFPARFFFQACVLLPAVLWIGPGPSVGHHPSSHVFLAVLAVGPWVSKPLEPGGAEPAAGHRPPIAIRTAF
eukprot:scaffold408_cov347-Pavlova_lutheri.AAC.55